MKLIPTDIPITLQFKKRNEFMQLVANWAGISTNPFYIREVDCEELTKVSGVHCTWCNKTPSSGFMNSISIGEIVDHNQYLIFVIKYSS